MATNSRKKDPGPSVKDPDLYEKLRDQGESKGKSARIANSAARSSRRQVGKRGGSSPAYDEWTRRELYDRARQLGVEGRSRMSKAQLITALRTS